MDSTKKLLRETLDEKLIEIESQGNVVLDLRSSSFTDINEAIKTLYSSKLEESSIKQHLLIPIDKSALDEDIKTLNALNLGKSSLEQCKNLEYFIFLSVLISFKQHLLRKNLVHTLERRLFYIPSDVAGLYDYGPLGWVVKSNVLVIWRQHFVQEENMLEVDCPCVTPEVVFKASDHVEKFTDLMVKDDNTGTCYRVNHLVLYSCSRIKNPLSDPYPFNLMFQTSIGPSGSYIRPETAPGIFVDFSDFYHHNGSLLLEFTLAEIAHFVDPEVKSYPKYSEVVDLEFLMFPRDEQMTGKDAVKLRLGTVNNETPGYFIGRVYLFLTRLGISKERLRFRQHLANEKIKKERTDCWDAEIECSYGWIKCVGIADRTAYDLRAHSERSGTHLVAHEKFSAPKEKLVITPVKKELGLAFKGNQKKIVEALEAMNEKEAMEVKVVLESKGEVGFQVCTLGKVVTIKSNMVSISKEIKKEHQRVFTPSVIEPSYSIGRIIYCLFEHSFYTRPSNYTRPSKAEDGQLIVFSFPPVVAPIKCTVFPLVQDPECEAVAKQISKSLTAAGISHRIDIIDELGVPFSITVHPTTRVTIQERDSKDPRASTIGKDFTDGVSTWADIQWEYLSHSSMSTAGE
ncbi:hypothetical protein MKX03_008810 [Papaver bracteatum]|nr:hypothetical protein MKX03_008810 [Papaver bracteatum]